MERENRKLPRALVLSSLLALAHGARADVVQIAPAKDNSLFEPDLLGDRSNARGPQVFAGRIGGFGGGVGRRRAVLAFDIAASVPAGATITGVTLTVTCSQVSPIDSFNTRTQLLRRATRSWGEGTSDAGVNGGQGAPPTAGDATWNHAFFPGTPWTTPGGDFTATVSSSVGVTGTGVYTFPSSAQLVADVQDMLDDPAGDFGWVLSGEEIASPSARAFDSREAPGYPFYNGTAPVLEVTFVPAPCTTLDFGSDDEGQPLVHGQRLGNGDPEFDGGSLFPVTLTSSSSTAAILDSDAGPASQDPDLLVGTGNVLILQTDANTSECPPGSGIYCSHNDDEDGGTLSFAFASAVAPASVVLVDIDATDGTSTVVLTDGAGARRTYGVPASWTGDLVVDGPPGTRTLDLTTLADQPGFGSTATAAEDLGFDPSAVVRIDVHLGGSGGVDDLSWCSAAPLASVRVRQGAHGNGAVLSSSALPVLGTTWSAELDCSPLGRGLATLAVRRRADPGSPTPFGELLVTGELVSLTTVPFSGTASSFPWDIPSDLALLGTEVHVQGFCRGAPGAVLGKLRVEQGRLSNALDLVLGF
jgi:hypothetical protein